MFGKLFRKFFVSRKEYDALQRTTIELMSQVADHVAAAELPPPPPPAHSIFSSDFTDEELLLLKKRLDSIEIEATPKGLDDIVFSQDDVRIIARAKSAKSTKKALKTTKVRRK